MVSMASLMDRGYVLSVITIMSHNMVTILQLHVQQYHVMKPWFTAHIFDIGHPCYSQLTQVKTRYLLTGIT